MDYRETQEQQSLNPKDYEVVVCVFGTRYWNDKVKFHKTLIEYLEQFDKPVLFLSGGASTGADDFIIQWCKRYRFPCLIERANWTRADGTTNRAAGFERNETMSLIATHGLGFWDGKSRGTKDMMERCLFHNHPVTMVDVHQGQSLPAQAQRQSIAELYSE